jgi:hypothetical protein
MTRTRTALPAFQCESLSLDLPSPAYSTPAFAMHPKDIVEFDRDAYRAKVRGLSVAELRQRESTKTKQAMSSAATAGFTSVTGIATLPVDAGLTLASSVFSGRAADVAEYKLEIVQEELRRRGEKVKENVTTEDAVAAGVAAVVGQEVGDDVNNGLKEEEGEQDGVEGAALTAGNFGAQTTASELAGGWAMKPWVQDAGDDTKDTTTSVPGADAKDTSSVCA